MSRIHAAQVRGDSFRRKPQLQGNLLVALSFSDQSEDLAFAVREMRLNCVGCGSARSQPILRDS
jgi:hypothetical protein